MQMVVLQAAAASPSVAEPQRVLGLPLALAGFADEFEQESTADCPEPTSADHEHFQLSVYSGLFVLAARHASAQRRMKQPVSYSELNRHLRRAYIHSHRSVAAGGYLLMPVWGLRYVGQGCLSGVVVQAWTRQATPQS